MKLSPGLLGKKTHNKKYLRNKSRVVYNVYKYSHAQRCAINNNLLIIISKVVGYLLNL